ncbi:MAG TPA: hypothetical protein VFF14_09485 [Candidatus Deferrimicrobium sp.]|nr:hypothetical protein [Candidatus Deferrimicrobium sp.]
MEKKYLRWIGITAAVLTVLMLLYTLVATMTSAKEQTSNSPAVQPGQVACEPDSKQTIDKLFPTELAGMTRIDVVTGEKAIETVSKMHGTNIAAANAYVVSYQGNGKNQLLFWVSDSKNEVEAKALFTSMDSKMPTTSYFKNYKAVNIAGKEYKSVTSQDGMQHYYWLKGVSNIWVGIVAQNPAEVLKQIAPLYQ